jgi:Right handed beta helix region
MVPIRCAAVVLFLSLVTSISAATFTVTSSNDAGPGTFRQAILDANGSSGLDQIRFAITTVSVTSELPPVTSPLDIDGLIGSGRVDIMYVEPIEYSRLFRFAPGANGSVLRNAIVSESHPDIGYTVVTIEEGVAGVSLIDSDFRSGVSTYGSAVRIERIRAFSLYVAGGPDVQILGGTFESTHVAEGVTDVRVGLPGNGNSIRHLTVSASPGISIRNNTFTGPPIHGFSFPAIRVSSSAAATAIVEIDGNTISGGYTTGIALGGNARVQRNTIRGNTSGIRIDWFFPTLADIRIGGATAAEGNTIRDNGTGVEVAYGTGIRILSNAMFNNRIPIELGRDGLTPNDPAPDADEGPNTLQNYPVLTSRLENGSLVIDGTLTSNINKPYLVQLFWTDAAGTGQTLLASFNAVTNGSGEATFSRTITPAPGAAGVVTATATHNGSTSEAGASAHLPGHTIPTASTWALLLLAAALAAITLNRIGN